MVYHITTSSTITPGILTFGYIPHECDAAGNVDKIRKAVIGGSLAPLVMFLVWNAVILGTVSSDAGIVADASGGVFDPLEVPRARSSREAGRGCAFLRNQQAYFRERLVTRRLDLLLSQSRPCVSQDDRDRSKLKT